MANFTPARRSTIYAGGHRIDAFQTTVTADDTMLPLRLHFARYGISLCPLCVTTGNAEGIVTWTDATTFGAGTTASAVLATISQTANTEQFHMMAWGV